MMKKRVLKLLGYIPFIIYLITVVAVAYSAIKSGFFHQFDIDELINSQKTYLIWNGYKPFIYYFSIYSPIIHWLLLPVFTITGFTFEGLTAARLLMILLFSIRILLIFIVSWKIFGRLAAYLFVLLFLLDPFTVFSAMQIRPDNLALLFFNLALVVLLIGLIRNVKKYFIISGFFLSLAFLTSIKVMPSVVVTIIIYFLYGLRKKSKIIIFFLIGLAVPCLAFLAYFFIQGSLFEMIQQLYIDSVNIINSNRSLAPLGFFYQPDNGNLYGFYGKPPAWFYVWILPLMAFIGAYETLISVVNKKGRERNDLIKVVLLLSLVLQWLSLFFTESVYLQYFLPVGWLFALFSAVSLDHLYRIIKPPLIKYGLAVFFSVCLLYLSYSSIGGNFLRADGAGFWITRDFLNNQKRVIPDGAYVFPNILFHPPVNEFVLGYPLERVPEYIVKRYRFVPEVLEKKKVPYLFYSMYYNIFLRPEWMPYISAHYQQSGADSSLWIRKD